MTTGSTLDPAPLAETPQLADGTSESTLGKSPGSEIETETTDGSRRLRELDSEQLVGFGELGLLPSLLQSLGPVGECDFDDAFSTCQ